MNDKTEKMAGAGPTLERGTGDHLSIDFGDGRSANVSIYETDKGTMVLVTHDAVNPMNHGDELRDHRDTIADAVCKDLNCDPRDIQYVEQAGQHYQTVPLERSPEGEIRIPDNTRVMFEPTSRVEEAIRQDETIQMDPAIAQRPDWADYLRRPTDHSVDR